MTKILMTSAAALMLTVGTASAGIWAQNDAYGNPLPVPAYSQQQLSGSVAARPQVYFGTGYSGPGTATGGPAGGLPNRN